MGLLDRALQAYTNVQLGPDPNIATKARSDAYRQMYSQFDETDKQSKLDFIAGGGKADEYKGSSPLQRMDRATRYMSSSPNKAMQEEGSRLRQDYWQRATTTTAKGKGGMTWEQYEAASPETKKLNDRFRGFQPAAAIQKAQLLGEAKNPEEYKQLIAMLGMDEWADVGTGFVNTALLGLPQEMQTKVRKEIKLAEGRKKIGQAEGAFVNNFDSEMVAANNIYDNLTFTMSAVNDLAGMTDYSTTGFAKFISGIPLTSSKEWSSLKETILSRLSLDKLTDLKKASATGATGLGALSEKELGILQNYLGNLDQAQSPKAIKKVTGQVYDQLRKMQTTLRKGQRSMVDKYDKLAPAYTNNVSDTTEFRDERYDPDYLDDMLRSDVPVAAPGYTIGQQDEGYEYTGGDPSSEGSWRKL